MGLFNYAAGKREADVAAATTRRLTFSVKCQFYSTNLYFAPLSGIASGPHILMYIKEIRVEENFTTLHKLHFNSHQFLSEAFSHSTVIFTM